MHKKINSILTYLLLLIIIFTLGISIKSKMEDIDQYYLSASAVSSIIKNQKKETTTLFFVGDMMLTRGVESSVIKNFNGDYNTLFDNVSELKNADILFGNLEGDVSDVGNNVGSKYSFRMNPSVIPALKNAGFDIVSFANNHVGDWSMSAFKDTMLRLAQDDILKTGAGINKDEAKTPTIIEKNGIKFGFLGFSDVGPDWLVAKDDTPGILLASDPNIENIIKEAKLKCDVLIVSFHWGEEYKLVHNNRQETLAHTAIDSGADMIIGHHPHVIQDIREYKGKPIIYSLGNFIFDQHFSKETMRGMLFSATFNKNNLIKTEQKIITLNKQYQPEGIYSMDEIRDKDELASSPCPQPKKSYLNMSFLNIGQIIHLPDITYTPENLRELNEESSIKEGICLDKEARNAFESMVKEANRYGYMIKASSGFRSYEHQKNLLASAINSGKSDADISIAKAGYSEHQLGTAIDLTGASVGYGSAVESFDDTPEDAWLKQNAYLYGFAQSYPKGKENITGYKYEPWHYRYVGIENAKKIKEGGLTITEFLK